MARQIRCGTACGRSGWHARGLTTGAWLLALSIGAAPVAAQVNIAPAPNLVTLYPNTTVLRQQYDYTGTDQVITAPPNAVGVYFKMWGGGGGREIVVSEAKAGAGGYTGAVFDTTAGTQYTLVVGGGGNRSTRPDASGAPAQQGVYGFGGTGMHDQGGGLSGVFTGSATVTRTDRGRALAVAGGGGGADDSSVGHRVGGTNGNGVLSGHGTVPGTLSWNYSGASNTGRSAGPAISGTMQGSNDGYIVPANGTGCTNVQWPTNWQSAGGGGYEGGGRVDYGRVSAGGCGVVGGAGGRGGSGFVATSARFQSIEWTNEVASADNDTRNVAPRHGTDTDQSNAVGRPRAVAIGIAGQRSNFAFDSNVNGGGDGRIVVYWILRPTVKVQKVSTPIAGGPFTFTATNLLSAPGPIITASPGVPSPAAPTAIVVSAPGSAISITEQAAPGFEAVGVVCTDANSLATGNTNPVATGSGASVTIPAGVTEGKGADITCVFSNRQAADLSITKTNTPGQNGERDWPDDAVVQGLPTTYRIVVTNHSPLPVGGAVVSDPAASRQGLDCPAGTLVSCVGPPGACPASSLTLGQLESGYALGTLPAAGGAVTLQFSCTVP